MASYDGLITLTITRADGSEEIIAPQTVTEDSEMRLETKLLELTNSAQKYVDALVVELSDAAQTQLQVEIGITDDVNTPPEWCTPLALSPGAHAVHPPGGLTSRYFVLRFSEPSTSVRWHMTGLEFYGRQMLGRI